MSTIKIIYRTSKPIFGLVGASVFISNFLTGTYLDQKTLTPKGDLYNIKYSFGKGVIYGCTTPIFVPYVIIKSLRQPCYIKHKDSGFKFNEFGLVPYMFPGYSDRRNKNEFIDDNK